MKVVITIIFFTIFNLFANTDVNKNSDSIELTQAEKEFIQKTKFNIYVTNWEPFTVHFKDHVDGISAGVWEKAVTKANIQYKYIKDEDFAQALKLIEKDEKGMIIATSSTKEREKYAAFTKPFISFPVSIATNVDKDFILDLKELEGKRVAVGENYTAYFLLKKHFPKIELVPTKDTIEALDLLANKKVYAAADILPVLIFNMNKYNFTNLKISGTSKFNFDVKFMVNKHSQEIIPILNKLIEKVTEDEKQEILNKWIYTKQITKIDYTFVYVIAFLSILVISFMFYRQKILKDKEELIASERYKYKSILDLASDGIHILDQNGKLIEYSKSFSHMLGYEHEEMVGMHVGDWDYIKYTKNQGNSIISTTSEARIFETKHKRKDGTIIDVQISAKGIVIENEHYLYASARDISENKQKEKQLQDSEFRWKFAIEGSGDGLWDWNLKTDKVFYSKQWKKMLGFEDDEIGDSIAEWKKRVNPKHLKDVQNDIDNYLVGFTEIYKNEHQVLCKDGTYKWVLDRGMIVQRDRDGKPSRIIGTHTDIDDIKTIQKLMAEQKQEFESIFRYSKDGIAILDKETKFLKFNDAFLKLTGFSKKELLNKTSKELTAPEDLEFTDHIIENIFKDEEAATYEKTFIFKDDKRVSLNISLSLLPDKERLLIVAKDVTSLRILENQSKLAAMGEMIGNIAHQWRQPLSIISTTASGMKLKFQFDKNFDINSINQTADTIVQQTKYLSKTIDDFRNFIKGDHAQKDISVVEMIKGSISLVDAVLKNSYINTIIDLEDDMNINGNKNELQQAIINILNNAKDVIKENISENKDRLLFISTKKENDKVLVLKIMDSAGGIDENIIKRIFEPYFTTKHKSVGTGLGLSMVDKIIRERHTFNISVHNEEYTYEGKEYRGACFSIIFFRN